jgi:uncharacterized protein
MADVRYQSQTQAQLAIDQGLRSYMLKVYNYMSGGLVLTAATAVATYMAAVDQTGNGLTAFGAALFTGPMMWILLIAQLGIVFFLSFRVQSMSVASAQLAFWAYAALTGVTFASLGMVYAHASIARVFMITAATFGAMSLYGYTTRRDLTGLGSFLFMGLIGLIIASVVNIFFASTAMTWVLSVIGVGIFIGLTAYDTQKIKEMYFEGDDVAVMGRKAIMGALSLYLDFINLFLQLLRLFGNSRN